MLSLCSKSYIIEDANGKQKSHVRESLKETL